MQSCCLPSYAALCCRMRGPLHPRHERVIRACREAHAKQEAEDLARGVQLWLERDKRLKQLIHEAALVPVGPAEEVQRWHPPKPARLRTVVSLAGNLQQLGTAPATGARAAGHMAPVAAPAPATGDAHKNLNGSGGRGLDPAS